MSGVGRLRGPSVSFMNATTTTDARDGSVPPWLWLGLGVLLAVLAWGIPVRWRWLHPDALAGAGVGSTPLVGAAETWVVSGRPGPARWMAAAATELGLPGTNSLLARIQTASVGVDVRVTGGVGVLTGRLAGVKGVVPTNGMGWASDLFRREEDRQGVRQALEGTRSVLASAWMKARGFAPKRFAAVDRAGGQALDSVIVSGAIFSEGDVFTPGFAAVLQPVLMRTVSGQPNDALEEICLDLFYLSRRLDWTSLRELIRVMPDPGALRQWVDAVQRDERAWALLYSATVLTGRPAALAQRVDGTAEGRASLGWALRGGVGSVRRLAMDARPVLVEAWGWSGFGRWAAEWPEWVYGVRTGLLLLSALGLALGTAGVLEVEDGGRGMGLAGVGALTLVMGFLLVLPSEPMVPGRAKGPQLRVRLDTGGAAGKGPAERRNRERLTMEPSTIATIALFAVLQLTVYVVCRRKITEIESMTVETPMRLRLLENEENLFDAGLYVGIAGTATALVLQVLHVVEANLLAAYSSNLLGIVTVALVKIHHVRPARRRLILEGRGSGPQ